MISILVFALLSICRASDEYRETKLDGKMKELSVAREYNTGKLDLFGINDQDQIMTCKLPCDGSTNKWTSIPGKAAHISANEQEIYIALEDFSIKRCQRPCKDGKWEVVPGLLRTLTVNNEVLWGVNMNGDVFRTPARPKKPVAWENMAPGIKFKWVTVGLDGEVWGVHDNGQVVRFDSSNSSWKQTPGNAKRISVGAKHLFAVSNEDTLFHCERPCEKGEWKPVQATGTFKDVSAEWSGPKIYGLKGDNSVFEADFSKLETPIPMPLRSATETKTPMSQTDSMPSLTTSNDTAKYPRITIKCSTVNADSLS